MEVTVKEGGGGGEKSELGLKLEVELVDKIGELNKEDFILLNKKISCLISLHLIFFIKLFLLFGSLKKKN
ncbi:unnamed protein product [marine sediment metagenome]|uniref:Uncharacterized protein n=1 Tax=marine sediment metagenome TaxID=412755 RepID=X1E4N5_9ZZZZ